MSSVFIFEIDYGIDILLDIMQRLQV